MPSRTISNVAARTRNAFTMAATGSARRRPNVKRGVGRRTATRIAMRLIASARMSIKRWIASALRTLLRA